MPQQTVTIHHPAPKNAARKGCTQQWPECNPSHWYAVPVIETRGRWTLMDMLDDNSLRVSIEIYNRLRNS